MIVVLAAGSLAYAQEKTSAAVQPDPPDPVSVTVQQDSGAPRVLTPHIQKSMFVKSAAANAKAAIADVLITQVGLSLLTMGMSSELAMNPYANMMMQKTVSAGKSILFNHDERTDGFEYDFIPGVNSPTALHAGAAAFSVPLNALLSNGLTPDKLSAVLVKVEPRPKDQARVLAARKVQIKEVKTGRFDLKPTTVRDELSVEQSAVPVDISRADNGALTITTEEPLVAGEYALVLRTLSAKGEWTNNVASPATNAVDSDSHAPQTGALTPQAMPAMAAAMIPGASAFSAMRRFSHARQAVGVAAVNPAALAVLSKATGSSAGMVAMMPGGASLAGLMGGNNSSPQVTTSLKNQQGYLAWDFRVEAAAK